MSPEEVNNHLEQGKRLLANGQLVDALNHYGKAIGKHLRRVHLCIIYHF